MGPRDRETDFDAQLRINIKLFFVILKLTGPSCIFLVLYLLISAKFSAAFSSAIPTTVHHHSMDQAFFLGVPLSCSTQEQKALGADSAPGRKESLRQPVLPLAGQQASCCQSRALAYTITLKHASGNLTLDLMTSSENKESCYVQTVIVHAAL